LPEEGGKPVNRLTSFSAKIQRLAPRQLADYDACHPGTVFAEGLVMDVAQAYELQAAVSQLRRDRGERVIGYKVGCTSKAIRSQLGINHCISGRLYDSEQYLSGAVLPLSRFAELAIEGELAVELSKEPIDEDFSTGGIPDCVSRVFPVVEMHHHVLRGEHRSVGELIANNAIHSGFVGGIGVSRHDFYNERCIDLEGLSIFANNRLLGECSGTALVQTMNSSLKWLTEAVRTRGDRLGAGQIVLTGSAPSLMPIAEGCQIRVDAQPLGSVEVNFIS
jgi:2-keto-4-pentenoate hydratase